MDKQLKKAIADLQSALMALPDDQLQAGLRASWDAVKAVQTLKAKGAVNAFEVGDKVEFEGKGRKFVGVVERVNQKTLSVRCDPAPGEPAYMAQRWRVGAHLAKKVTR